MDIHNKIYQFFDGDFTFHTKVYSQLYKNSTHVFRVRINQDPHERAIQNTINFNNSPLGWFEIRPATENEISEWLNHFSNSYPQRLPSQTEAIRALILCGSISVDKNSDLYSSFQDLVNYDAPCVWNFQMHKSPLIEIRDNHYHLTENGKKLAALIK